MPNAQRINPYRNPRFCLEIDGINVAGFTEVTIPDSSTESVDYREGNWDPNVQFKLSGLTKYGNITLKKGLTDSLDLYNWRLQVEQKGALSNRRELSIVLIDEEGNDKARWDVVAAWPSKYSTSGLNAKANEVVIETLELVHEGVTRKK